MKKCNKCSKYKQLIDFNKSNNTKDSLQHKCRECEKEYKNLNIERIKIRDLEYRSNNKENIDSYQKLNYYKNIEVIRSKHRIYTSIYSKNNRGKVNALGSKYRALRLKSTPNWLTEFDLNYIEHIYIQAKELEKLDGVKYEVDHIIPLQGKTVCGLHVPWNLQIITKSENSQKSNKLLSEAI